MINGQISVIWTEQDYINLPYDDVTKVVERSDYAVHTNNYNIGVSSVYENLPQVFHDSVKFLNLSKTVIAINRMAPEQILPFHTDKYATYKKRNNVSDDADIKRVIVFLHDQKAGHQLWIKDQICVGPAGSYFGWNVGDEHMAANFGKQDRYVLQVTGIK
jgi:hypothetical protein